MISQGELQQLASRWMPPSRKTQNFQVHTDTTDFFRVEYGDVIFLDGKHYLVRHNAKEGRFGIDDDIKFWVKNAIDLQNGNRKIIKLVFYEKMKSRIGGIEFDCFRSPKKEARILSLVSSHKNFMHGFSCKDQRGNIVRVLDFIEGQSLHIYIGSLNLNHQIYFYNHFPDILKQFTKCIEAVLFLHEHGEKHGDIRRDHILNDRNRGHYRWIDFDFNYRHRENIYSYDLFGLCNVLLFLAGMGDILLHDLKRQEHPALEKLREGDVNILFNNRVANIRKIYPYIPESLNLVLMHFSKGSNWFYENTQQLLDDLREFNPSS